MNRTSKKSANTELILYFAEKIDPELLFQDVAEALGIEHGLVAERRSKTHVSYKEPDSKRASLSLRYTARSEDNLGNYLVISTKHGGPLEDLVVELAIQSHVDLPKE